MILANSFIALIGATLIVGIGLLLCTFAYEGLMKLFHLHSQRPSLITILCLFWVVSMVAYTANIFSSLKSFPMSSLLNLIYPVIVGLAVVGLWRMKRWGLLLLTSIFVVLQIVHVSTHIWTFASLVYFLFILPGFFYYRKMS